MIKKLLVIGIDGMDWDVIKKYERDLPNISTMLQQNNYPHLRSVFPADTTPAWTTIFTGLDPSQHGIINFVNIGDKENKYKPLEFNDSAFKDKVFWDKLKEKGIRSTILLPMNIKEGWDIEGLMITRPYLGKINVWPESKRHIYQPRENILGLDAKFTSEQHLDELYQEYVSKIEEEFRLTKLALENEECDLMFTYFSVIDGIQHDFWRHCDTSHPEYPGETKYTNVIHDMYVKMDYYIGKIIEAIPNLPILIISDHGHGARPVFVARVNEMLRRGGFLTPKQIGSINKSFNIKKTIKKAAITFVRNFGLPKWFIKAAKRVPVWKGIFASSNDFDWTRTQAYLSDLSALKNYSYGGIRISADVADKKKLCNEIISYLKEIVIEGENTPLFTWIKRSDEVYHGKMLNKYPEIIFQMDERFGADWSLGDRLFEKQGFMHKLSPGSHRRETASIMSRNFKLEKEQYEMTDIYPMILDLAAME